jgi:hypothetical protein
VLLGKVFAPSVRGRRLKVRNAPLVRAWALRLIRFIEWEQD